MVVILTIAVVVLAIFVVSLTYSHMEIRQQLESLDREQHNQNMDIIKLMKEDNEIKGMLLQHVEILKYLVEQDPKLNNNFILMGRPGEA